MKYLLAVFAVIYRQVLGELVEQQLTLAVAAVAFKLSKRIAAYQQISTG